MTRSTTSGLVAMVVALGLTACDEDTTATGDMDGGRPDAGEPALDAALDAAGSTADAASADAAADAATIDDPKPLGVASAFTCPSNMSFGDPLAALSVATLIESGFTHGEGAIYVDAEQALFFSDLQDMDGADASYWRMPSSSKIMKYDVVSGDVSEWLAAGGTNGLALSTDGKSLIAASIADRTLTAIKLSDKSRSVLASKHMDTTFNVTNDLTVRSDGLTFVSDPLWQADLPGTDAGDPPANSMKVYGVSAAGKVNLVDDGRIQPNGVALSPDGKTLYVTALTDTGSLAPTWTGMGKVWKYAIEDDGTTLPGVLFSDVELKWPDGVTTDCAGNVYVANRVGVTLFRPDGTVLGEIELPVVTPGDADAGPSTENVGANNLAFGGNDHRTLYVIGNHLHSVALGVPGPN